MCLRVLYENGCYARCGNVVPKDQLRCRFKPLVVKHITCSHPNPFVIMHSGRGRVAFQGLTVAAFVAGAFLEDKTTRGVKREKYEITEPKLL